MGSVITNLIEKIQNPITKAFVFRFYNVFKSIVLPTVLGIILFELKEHGNFEGLVDEKVWVEAIYSIVLALVGSAVAGLDKINRMQK